MGNLYQFKVRLGVILIQEGKILLVRQNQRPFWVLPGGTLEVGEGLEECAVRELQEEVNLTVRIQKVLYLADFMRVEQDEVKQTIDIFMLAQWESGTPVMTEDENLDEMGFFTLEEFKKLPVQPEIVAGQILKDWPEQFHNANALYLGKYGVTVKH